MGIVSWVFWGLFVGAIARLLLPGRQSIGIIWTILLGVAGSVLGGFLALAVIVSVLASIVLVVRLAARVYAGGALQTRSQIKLRQALASGR